MIVVSDTSPLNYLILIGQVDLLRELFGEVVVPPSVRDELSHQGAPAAVSNWIMAPPPWLRIESPRNPLVLDLDKGEMDAISLAVEIGATALLIDERKGRNKAHELGITTLGIITLLEVAAAEGMVNLQDCFAKLQQTNFRVSPQLMAAALKRISDSSS